MNSMFFRFGFISALVFLFAGVDFANAQGSSIGISLSGFSPQRHLDTSGYNCGTGLSVDYFSPGYWKSNVFKLRGGFKFDFHGNGSHKENVILDNPSNDPGIYRINNTGLGLTFVQRSIFYVGKFSPYLDLSAGGRWFYSQEVVEPEVKIEGCNCQTITSISKSGTFVGGLGVGTVFNLSESIGLEFGMSYYKGGKVKFINLDGVWRDGNEVNYGIRSSKTDYVLYNLGVRINLSGGSNKMTSPVPVKETTYTPPVRVIKPVPTRSRVTRVRTRTTPVRTTHRIPEKSRVTKVSTQRTTTRNKTVCPPKKTYKVKPNPPKVVTPN